MDKSPEAFRTITEVSKWLDTPAHVLRFWESRFPEVSPVKRAGGRRYYRPEDMQILGGIKTMLHDRGQSIKDVQTLLASDGSDGIAALSPQLEFSDKDASSKASTPDRTPKETSPETAPVGELPSAEPEHSPWLEPDGDTTRPPANETDAPDESLAKTEIEAQPVDAPVSVTDTEREDASTDDTVTKDAAPTAPDVAQDSIDQPDANPDPLAALEDSPTESPSESGAAENTDTSSEEVFDRFADRRPSKRAQDAPTVTAPADGPTPASETIPTDASPFQSRRPRRSSPSVTEDAPKRGFFFNDMAEPALSDPAETNNMDLDRDDPSNYVGFSALNVSPSPEATPTETPNVATTPNAGAPGPINATPNPLQSLPKDPADVPPTWPTVPGIAAELRGMSKTDLTAQIGTVEVHKLADRLHALHARMRST